MKTAMIVDDEVVVVRAMKKRVNWEKFGISKVYEANSMKQAIEIFRKTEIDILFAISRCRRDRVWNFLSG